MRFERVDHSNDKHLRLMAIFGYIFNVTSAGDEFYNSDNTYALFVGHEATRSIAL